MKKSRFLLLYISLTSLFFVTMCENLGNLYDELMGKNTNAYYAACLSNSSKEPWVKDTRSAYFLGRNLFEKYSIEKGKCNEGLKVPKIIHQIWIGGPVPQKYAEWIATWPKYNPDWTHIIWMDHDLPYLSLFNKDLFMAAKNLGEKSDILRLELLNMFGGLYVDTDYECLQSFEPFNYCNSFYASSAGIGHNGMGLINALIGASPRHPLLEKLVTSMKAAASMPILSQRSGPMYFSKIFFENTENMQKDVVMYPAVYFTPDPKIARNNKRTYAIHWFDASWVKPSGLNQKMPYDPRLEKGLTPAFFKKNGAGKFSKLYPKLYYDIWSDIFSQLNKKSIVELGVSNFIIDSRMDIQDLRYIGISPVKFLAIQQRLSYMDYENRIYWWKDVLKDTLPQCGLLIIGDMMEYLPYKDCIALSDNLKQCEAEFIIIAHDEKATNVDTQLGNMRSLNICQEPFNFAKPDKLVTINKKVYGIWKNY